MSATSKHFPPDSTEVHTISPSPNIGVRKRGLKPSILVLHYTGLPTIERSIEVLSDPRCEVSCHYVIDLDGHIIQMVAEADRAWHAGLSSWQGETDINSKSIGIEIQNIGHRIGSPQFPPPFPDLQMRGLERLARDIITRHNISATDVVAHSDIAPGRKIDPGEKFDWRRLHRAGIGHWVKPEPIEDDDISRKPNMATADVGNIEQGFAIGSAASQIAKTQNMLRRYGYGIIKTAKYDDETKKVVTAFQRHFRPARIDGRIDRSTIKTLKRLLETSGILGPH